MVLAFIDSGKMQQWSDVRAVFKGGALPTIKLLNQYGEAVETYNIEKWNTDAIEEFLMERLEK